MRRPVRHIIFCFAALLLTATSCLKHEDSIVELKVQLLIPEESTVEIDMTQVEVVLQSKDIAFSYKAVPDTTGLATFSVRAGKYDLLCSAYFPDRSLAVNASRPEFLLTSEGIVNAQGGYEPPLVQLYLSIAMPNPLIIRELYYHGSTTHEGASYNRDQYFELYNNSGPGGETIYLDSTCVATVFPANSTSGNNAWLGSDTVAIFQMFWMFPGDGKTYPLAPGESAVVAVRAAVDHTQRATSGLQLNRAHFGCYADHLTGHEIAAGIPAMVCYMAGQGTAWGLSISSPAFVVFKPEMGVTEYYAHPEIWERYEPGRTSGTRYWHIPSSWIIDGVECVDTPEGALKRLPTNVDASYTYMTSARYSGKCVSRRLERSSEGIDIFMDTNNSAADFIADSPLSPRLRD